MKWSYEGRSFYSGTNAPLYHMAVRNSWKLWQFQGGGGVDLTNDTNFYLNPFILKKVFESSSTLA